jgi:hypothetical protein
MARVCHMLVTSQRKGSTEWEERLSVCALL